MGERGRWFVGLSGCLLLSNLMLGLKLAWPRAGGWRSLLRSGGRSPIARFYRWHRLLGLMGAIPAAATVLAGILLVFMVPIRSILVESGSRCSSEVGEALTSTASPATAIETAMARFPGARLAHFTFPDAVGDPYRIGLLTPAEVRRIEGATVVEISPVDGRVVRTCDPTKAGRASSLLAVVYPLHTGQIGGVLARVLVLGVALWLLSMIILGLLLWRSRRLRFRRKNATSPD